MQINFIVRGNRLFPENEDMLKLFFLTSYSQEYPALSFTFNNEWDGINTIKLLAKNSLDKTIYSSNIVNGIAYINNNALLKKGTVEISVYGEEGSKRITTNIVKFSLKPSNYTT